MVELALHLDPGSGTPLYEQLYGALAEQIRTGRLAEGTRLPGKRSLADRTCPARPQGRHAGGPDGLAGCCSGLWK